MSRKNSSLGSTAMAVSSIDGDGTNVYGIVRRIGQKYGLVVFCVGLMDKGLQKHSRGFSGESGLGVQHTEMGILLIDPVDGHEWCG